MNLWLSWNSVYGVSSSRKIQSYFATLSPVYLNFSFAHYRPMNTFLLFNPCFLCSSACSMDSYSVCSLNVAFFPSHCHIQWWLFPECVVTGRGRAIVKRVLEMAFSLRWRVWTKLTLLCCLWDAFKATVYKNFYVIIWVQPYPSGFSNSYFLQVGSIVYACCHHVAE